MVKKIFGNLVILVLIFSLNIYATSVPNTDEGIGDSSQSEYGSSTENDKENYNPNTPASDNNNDTLNSEKDNNKNTISNEENKNNISNESNKNTTNNTNKTMPTSAKPSVTITTPTKSNEARLKKMKIDIEGISPEFNKEVTEYYITTDLSTKSIKVTASPLDNKASVTVIGSDKLKEGKNTITINVKAEDGTVKKYYIYVTKVDDMEKANAELASLEVQNYNLYPSFKPNIYNYNLNINESIEGLEIITEAQKEKATIEIEGNNNLKEGENLIKINVTAQDGTTIRTYKINAYISSKMVKVDEESKLPGIIMLIIIGICIISLMVWFIIKNKRNNY